MSATWSSEPPRRAGMWWYRASNQSDGQIVRVYLDGGSEWSVQYDNLSCDPNEDETSCDYCLNWLNDGKAEWCYIPTPREPRRF